MQVSLHIIPTSWHNIYAFTGQSCCRSTFHIILIFHNKENPLLLPQDACITHPFDSTCCTCAIKDDTFVCICKLLEVLTCPPYLENPHSTFLLLPIDIDLGDLGPVQKARSVLLLSSLTPPWLLSLSLGTKLSDPEPREYKLQVNWDFYSALTPSDQCTYQV